MAIFDKKQAPGVQQTAVPKVAAAPTTGARKPTAPAGGYDAQRAGLTPNQTPGYGGQRDAMRPDTGKADAGKADAGKAGAGKAGAVTEIDGIALGQVPDGPQNEPSRKKKKKKKTNNQTPRPTVAPAPAPVTPAPVTPAPVTAKPADPVVAEPVAPALVAPTPLDPMADASVNPDATNEYAMDARYMQLNGVIAVQGEGDANAIDANDVKQGSIGNCYFVAQLAAQAKADPSVIQNLIKDNGNGSYTVSLYLKDKRQPWKRNKTDIVISSEFPTSNGTSAAYAKPGDVGKDGAELWVMLIEKAFAKHAGGYEETRGKKTPDGDVFGLMTGVNSGYREMSSLSGDNLLKLCEGAVKGGKPVSFGAINTSASETEQAGAKAAGVVLNHAYSLAGVDRAKRTISLRNPWGSKHLDDVDVDVIRQFYSSVRVGA